MKKTNLKIAIIAGTIIAVAIVMLWQKETAERWAAEAPLLGELSGQVTLLQEENRSLQEQLDAAIQRSQAMEQRNPGPKTEAGDLSKLDAPAQPKEEWMDREYGQGTADRAKDCWRWAFALICYASEHDEQFPTSLRV